ncbi:hypothetical protein ACOME3_002582 [Neoechinorhynchus agilis]
MELAPNLEIPVSMYIKVRESKPSVFKFKKVLKSDPNVEIETRRRLVRRDDPENPLEYDDIVSGYMYGSTFVPFDRDDASDLLKYESERSLKLIGFTPLQNLKTHLFTSDGVYQVIPSKDETTTLYSALLASLYETQTAAIVRKIYRKGCQPEIGALIPSIKHSCFYYYRLPFAQDIKDCEFKEDDSQVSEAQALAIDRLIDCLDMCATSLSDFGTDELFKPQNTFNPSLQRKFQCLSSRFIDPNSSVDAILSKGSELDDKIYRFCSGSRVEEAVEAVRDLFDIKPIESAIKTGAEMFKDVPVARIEGPIRGDSVDIRLFNEPEQKERIGSLIPDQDYSALTEKYPNLLHSLSISLYEVIKDLILASDDTLTFFDRALQCWSVMREVCLKRSEPNVFNEILKGLKESIQVNSRIGEFWPLLVQRRITLINRDECSNSHVLKEEAEAFLEEDEGLGTVDEGLNEDDLVGVCLTRLSINLNFSF